YHNECFKYADYYCETDINERYGRIWIRFGEIENFNNENLKTVINIEECTNLPPMDPNYLADPFLKIFMIGDKTKKELFKSAIKKNTRNPFFKNSVKV
ncbi:MAG: hypothetical protein MHPSP_004847, partial [Paramarteilia canceri]